MRRWPFHTGRSRYGTVARQHLPLPSLPGKDGHHLGSSRPRSHVTNQECTRPLLQWLLLAELIIGLGLIATAIVRSVLQS